MAIDMGQHFSVAALLRYALPSILMMIFTSIYTVVDGLFVSNFVGTTAFAAINIVFPIIMIFGAAGFMIGTGGSAIVAKTRGEGDDERANRYFSFLIYSSIVIGTILAVLGIFLVEPACHWFGAEEAMLKDCILYGRIAMISMPAFFLQFAFQAFFITAGKPNMGFGITVIAGCTNIVLDALYIAGFGWGVAGAALATITGEFIGGCVPLVYFARKNTSHLRLGHTGAEFRVLGKACVNGSSEMVNEIATSIVIIIFNYQLLRLMGEYGVAAYGVIGYVFMLFSAIYMGFNTGTAPLMSFQYGAQNHPEMQSLFRKSIWFMIFAGIAMFLLSQATAGAIAYLYTGYDPELCAITERAFRIFAIAYLFMGVGMYSSALFTALNNGLISALLSFLRTFLFETSMLILLPLWFGAESIWYATSIAEVLALVLGIIFMVALGRRYGYLKPRLNDGARYAR